MVTIAKRNHYNPCFWTAHWNPDYFDAARRKLPGSKARDQRVFVLSVKANKLYTQTVGNVHYDKNICVAEITMEAADDYCRRILPWKIRGLQAGPEAGGLSGVD